MAFAGRDPGYGGFVIVDHGGQLDTLYAHLSALYVREASACVVWSTCPPSVVREARFLIAYRGAPS